MFACCDPSDADMGHSDEVLDISKEVLDIAESAAEVGLLLDLLHSPPELLPAEEPPRIKFPSLKDKEPQHVETRKIIPLPIIPQLLSLADKYILPAEITEAIHSHLLAQAPTNPLWVYGFAILQELPEIASIASYYLLNHPMDELSYDQILDNMPNLKAYHQIIQLQGLRTRRLKEVLMAEPIFPHGYGRCDNHEQKTVMAWEQRKQGIAWRIHAGESVYWLLLPQD